MALVYDPATADALSAPHVFRAWFLALDLPSGWQYLHSGCGTVHVDGHAWRGVGDPDPVNPTRLLSVSTVQEPRFGAAAAVTFALAGVSAEFMHSLRVVPVEGRAASVSWAAFDGETQQPVLGPVSLFPRGRMTAPTRKVTAGVRTVTITIEGPWSSLNFAPGGRWSSADQHRRYPGDKGLDLIGVNVIETWQ